MTDTRSPEQRRQDERNLAYVARMSHEDKMSTMSREQRKAYRAGRAAGLAGWNTRGTEGQEHHELACDAAERLGTGPQWRDGYREGRELRERETAR